MCVKAWKVVGGSYYIESGQMASNEVTRKPKGRERVRSSTQREESSRWSKHWVPKPWGSHSQTHFLANFNLVYKNATNNCNTFH